MKIEDASSLTDLAGLLAVKNDGGADEGDHEGETPEIGSEEDNADPKPEDQGEDGNPEDGTRAEAEGEEDGESREGEESDDEPNTDPVYTVKIDGKDVQVTLKEALGGYQRQADYTRKTQEVAAARTALEADHAAIRTQRDQYANVLRVVQERLGPADQERTQEQWDALKQSDPERYPTEWADFQRRTEARGRVKAEQDRVAAEQNADQLTRVRSYVDGEREKLFTALPVLKDPAKGPTEMKAIREYAKEAYGFSDKELDQSYDHRMVVMANDARQWRSHVKALAAAKAKIKGAPALPEPGSRQPQKSRKTAARVEQQKRFEKTGRVEDGAALLLS